MEGRLIGNYRIVRLLGSGGMGEVWEAQETSFRDQAELLKAQRDQPGTRHLLSIIYYWRGEVAFQQERLDDAAESYAQAMALSRALVEAYPSRGTWRWHLGRVLRRRGALLLRQGRREQARAAVEEARAHAETAAAQSPGYRHGLALALARVAEGDLHAPDDLARASGYYAQARQELETLLQQHPGSAPVQHELLGLLVRLTELTPPAEQAAYRASATKLNDELARAGRWSEDAHLSAARAAIESWKKVRPAR